MDFLIKHFAPLPRSFPGCVNIVSVGYIKEKRNWIRQLFDTVNFSFILSGTGEYIYRGQAYEVKSPCVITQTPAYYVEYGPTGETGCWEELYLVYPSESMNVFQRNKFIDPERPIWPINDYLPVRSCILKLNELARHVNREGYVDRIDRLCESMVLESLAGESRDLYSETDEQIRKARTYVRESFREAIDFDQLARKYGMSPASFRRHWLSRIGSPPARFQNNLRMQEACRLLVETRMSVGQIAFNVGFNDPLYFSRKFASNHSITPSDYRKTYQRGIAWLAEY